MVESQFRGISASKPDLDSGPTRICYFQQERGFDVKFKVLGMHKIVGESL